MIGTIDVARRTTDTKRRWWVRGSLVVAMAAITAVVYDANRRLSLPHGLHAEYFPARDERGSAGSAPYIDSLPSSSLLAERRPDCADHAFVVEWRGFIVVPASGTYTFRIISDGPPHLSVHGRGAEQNALATGVHSIDMGYAHGKGRCIFELDWSRDGRPFEPVPAWALLTERTSYARAAASRVTAVLLAFLAITWYVAIAVVSLTEARRIAARMFTVRREQIDPVLVVLLALSALLNAWGIWWALPNARGWAPDEVVAPDVLRAFHAAFSHGWYDKYPPFHYAVLAAVDSPILLLSSLGLADADRAPLQVALALIGRLVSLALAAATLVVIYRCGLQLYGRRGALFAALTIALTAPFVYYSKLANLDVPYLFWFTVSLFAYIRILQREDERDYLLFAASAALAGCTKDQAWGLYFVTPIAIVAARWRARRPSGRSIAGAAFDRTMLRALAVGIGTFLIADNVLFNFSGFVAHVMLLRATPAPFQEFPRSIAGELQMAGRVVREMRYMFGWPLTAIVAAALASGLARKTTTPSLGWLLVPVLSYYATFVGVVLFFFDRYLLPIAVVLALYVGWWLEQFLAPGVRARRARVAIVAAAFAYTAVYAVSVDYAMTRDSRYEVTRWLKAHARPDELTGSLGPLEYAMLAGGFRWRSVASVGDVAALQPDFIVLNADQMPTLPPAVQAMHQSLVDGRSGYRLALKVRSPSLPLPGRHPDLDATARHGPEFSDISMINPTMEVFERTATR